MLKKLLAVFLILVGGGLASFSHAWATTDVSTETFWAASGGTTSGGNQDGINLFWYSHAYPSGAGAAGLTASTVSAWIWGLPSPPPHFDEGHYADFAWTSTRVGGTITAGDAVYAMVPFYRYADQTTGNIEVKIRVAVNDVRLLSSVKILLEDDTAVQASSAELLGGMTSGSYAILTATFDLSAAPFSSGATESLRACLQSLGTTTADSTHVGATDLQIEYIAIRQYND